MKGLFRKVAVRCSFLRIYNTAVVIRPTRSFFCKCFAFAVWLDQLENARTLELIGKYEFKSGLLCGNSLIAKQHQKSYDCSSSKTVSLPPRILYPNRIQRSPRGNEESA